MGNDCLTILIIIYFLITTYHLYFTYFKLYKSILQLVHQKYYQSFILVKMVIHISTTNILHKSTVFTT